MTHRSLQLCFGGVELLTPMLAGKKDMSLYYKPIVHYFVACLSPNGRCVMMVYLCQLREVYGATDVPH